MITYNPENAEELMGRINNILANGEHVRRHLIKPQIEDTVKTEVKTIKNAFINANGSSV